MSRVLLISPPYMKLSYPPYPMPLALTKGCDYMNPGLLISSSELDKYNISNEIIKVADPMNVEYIKKQLADDTVLVGISCTCAWEYLESLKIAEVIKKTNSNIKILLAGWQVKSIKNVVFKDSQYIDYIVLGDAEYTTKKLYDNVLNDKNEYIPTVLYKNMKSMDRNVQIEKRYPDVQFLKLDFSKFPDYKKYLPYVEESRNCPYECKFCLNSCVKDRYQNVPLEVFKENVENIEKLYGKNCSAILLAANFGVNPKETKKKIDYLKTKTIKWNIELHVDNPWEYYIDDLKAAGINKVSIGFESGSPTTLKLMNKTKNPSRYLSRLEILLKKLNEQDINPSLNFLIDYRDTKETLTETLLFLEKNKNLIDKVKANFMFAFEGLLNNIDYSYNPNIIIDDYGKSIHAYPILPSNFSLERISFIIDEMEKGNYSLDILDEKNKVKTIQYKIQ